MSFNATRAHGGKSARARACARVYVIKVSLINLSLAFGEQGLSKQCRPIRTHFQTRQVVEWTCSMYEQEL